jgi:hypothetical protein
MRSEGRAIGRLPGVWQLRWDVARLRFVIRRAHRDRRSHAARVAAVLADAHRCLAREYAALALHRRLIADGWRWSRLWRKAALHAGQAQRYARLARDEGGAFGVGRQRGRGPRDLEGPLGVPQPRGRGPRGLVGGAAAEIEEDVRVRAVAGRAGERDPIAD